MLTTSLPPIPQGHNKAHISFDLGAHAAFEADTMQQGEEHTAHPRDYERTCTTQEGCDLDGANSHTPRSRKKADRKHRTPK